MDQVEKLTRDRNRALGASAILFLVWQAGWFLQDIAEKYQLGWAWADGPLGLFIAGSGLVWGLSMYWFWRIASAMKTQGLSAIIEDELSLRHEQKATRFAFMTLLLSAAGFLGLTAFIDLPGSVVARALVMVGVVAMLMRYVGYQGAEEVGEA